MKALFILKRRCNYGDSYPTGFTSGLYNSAKFVSDMLNSVGICSNIAEVVDNNGIDAEVTKYRPSHVFIEALWVVPEKFEILQKLHPKVKWVIRIHSNTPFLANEGIAVDWIKRYAKYQNVIVAPNSRLALNDLEVFTSAKKLAYLPNYYQFEPCRNGVRIKDPSIVKIGCFGAIRPLKNQLIQAIAAIRFAEQISRKLEFHINSERVEQRGDSVLKNLRALFADSNHTLVEHPWYPRPQFLSVIGGMDINMQVSFSETFNIVTADSINEFVPVVVSKSIDYVGTIPPASTIDGADITRKLMQVWASNRLNMVHDNWLSLQKANLAAVGAWLEFMIR